MFQSANSIYVENGCPYDRPPAAQERFAADKITAQRAQQAADLSAVAVKALATRDAYSSKLEEQLSVLRGQLETERATRAATVASLKKAHEVQSLFYVQQSDIQRGLAADKAQAIVQENQELKARLNRTTATYKHVMTVERERHQDKCRKDFESFQMAIARQNQLAFLLTEARKQAAARGNQAESSPATRLLGLVATMKAPREAAIAKAAEIEKTARAATRQGTTPQPEVVAPLAPVVAPLPCTREHVMKIVQNDLENRHAYVVSHMIPSRLISHVADGITVLEPILAEDDHRHVRTVVLLMCFFPKDLAKGGMKLDNGEYVNPCERFHCGQFPGCRIVLMERHVVKAHPTHSDVLGVSGSFEKQFSAEHLAEHDMRQLATLQEFAATDAFMFQTTPVWNQFLTKNPAMKRRILYPDEKCLYHAVACIRPFSSAQADEGSRRSVSAIKLVYPVEELTSEQALYIHFSAVVYSNAKPVMSPSEVKVMKTAKERAVLDIEEEQQELALRFFWQRHTTLARNAQAEADARCVARVFPELTRLKALEMAGEMTSARNGLICSAADCLILGKSGPFVLSEGGKKEAQVQEEALKKWQEEEKQRKTTAKEQYNQKRRKGQPCELGYDDKHAKTTYNPRSLVVERNPKTGSYGIHVGDLPDSTVVLITPGPGADQHCLYERIVSVGGHVLQKSELQIAIDILKKATEPLTLMLLPLEQ